MKGKVYLVGAGPGDPGLITVRGITCLRRADVVVYDRLVPSELLNYAPDHAERIYAGKAAGSHTLKQEEINQLLIARARAGQCVVRLKGGDPFVFGRGGEEALALVEAGISFEVVPGVSSIVAVPAYAGIPLTHRGIASSLVVRTGHVANVTHSIAHASTIIYLMGSKNLADIVAELLAEGRAVDTPAALIQWGTTPRQRTVTGDLGTIVELGRDIEPPVLLVVGPVVRLRQYLNWFEQRPLRGKRIVITRAREQASTLAALLAEEGAELIEFPTVTIRPLADTTALDRALLQPYDWIVFTSAHAVSAVWSRLWALGRDARAFGNARLCAIGPATAAALAKCGLCADLVPTEYMAKAIMTGLGPVAGQRILLPRSDLARPALAEGLRRQGAQVTEVIAYHTVITRRDDPRGCEIVAMLAAGQIDVLMFTSSSTVRGFMAALGLAVGDPPPFGAWPCVACTDPITAQTARELGIPVHITADTYTAAELVSTLISYFQGSR
ncbi:MAG: uroporphyrinogen-III C-methyltransferase [Anaerolineae bacterium]|nr:uroporphyrinogen-III C-methyltransferase [Anaerolineae bacterium]MDW8100916.1 uroporphyrinogen-III C-methyltransferase [Anaerolineae bacterium]